ncbi:hypothetical protein CYLTODRAFT_393387 [Cylindrobasidium torrendii FP15055 ss-10]|uniref:C3H1-type domain-containing protein n=1 Tax=Cylindrobasidium torrendii FP15055 ss-10 TaxID=1314674 RepID=A0A0D7BGM7_9AGAR|nr:hypothetical protein CYLTODRAFT_393387 [Cylindrobasidium torrendii FP15055 ss-10]
MHDVVTTASAPKAYHFDNQNDLLPPINLTNKHLPNDTISWHDPETNETWPPKSDSSPRSNSFIRSSPVGLSKPTHRAKMSSLSENKQAQANTWLYANGQHVNTDADWDLADQIVRLNISDAAGEGAHDPTIRTPPKKANPMVAHLADGSPLESSPGLSTGSSPPPDHEIITHSRGSSTDTTESNSHDSVNGLSLKESKERPNSYNGANLSSADLRNLQQAGEDDQQWPQYRESGAEPSYPSLANSTIHRPQPQVAAPSQLFDYRGPQAGRDEDYNARNFGAMQPSGAVGAASSFGQRPANGSPSQYRQTRGYPQQAGLMPSPPAMGFSGGHTAHISLGGTQQAYDMMMPPQDSPGLGRGQPANVYRSSHQHSASEPSVHNGIPPYTPAMYPPGMGPPSMMMYPGGYYGQDYARDARIAPQYTGGYPMPMEATPTGSSSGQNGPSANNRKLGLYKTELCRSWEEKGTCRYGTKCQFAHGEDELRRVQRHPKYKTEICRTFWVSGSCPYGKRCCFIHTELPNQGGANGPPQQETPPPPPPADGRARSMSTNSDPNEGGVSLLARISKRSQESNGSTPPMDVGNVQFSRPPTGSLRVDTSTLDGSAMKHQNKSAYPSFASNGVYMPMIDTHTGAKSPAPVTAGPDLGRHNSARLDIVGNAYNQRMSMSGTPPSNSNTPGHTYGMSNESVGQPRGHVRGGSWAALGRAGHLSSGSFSSSSGANDTLNSPWTATELTKRPKAWA